MNYLRVLPFIAVLAVILFTGLRPEPVPQVFDQQDKLHHLLGFAALMFTLRLAFAQWRVVWAVAACLGAAVLIELAQGLLPNRWATCWPTPSACCWAGAVSGWRSNGICGASVWFPMPSRSSVKSLCKA